MRVRIAGTGSYLPGPPIDVASIQAFLCRYPDGLTEHEHARLIAETGIRTRHSAIDLSDETRRESNTSMASAAGRRALAAAGWEPNAVDLLVVTTVVPDQLMPPTSTLVQEALGIRRCAEVEISANCTAPYKGLLFAASQLRARNLPTRACLLVPILKLARPPAVDESRATHCRSGLATLDSLGRRRSACARTHRA